MKDSSVEIKRENMSNVDLNRTAVDTEIKLNSDSMTENSDANKVLYDVIDEIGIIAKDTTVYGDLEAKCHLVIEGVVEGAVKTKGNLVVEGIVTGKIKCNDLVVKDCKLSTDVYATGIVQIKENVFVEGNITGKDILVNGTVRGDIIAIDRLALSSSAMINGSIKAGTLGADFGSKIKGSIDIG